MLSRSLSGVAGEEVRVDEAEEVEPEPRQKADALTEVRLSWASELRLFSVKNSMLTSVGEVEGEAKSTLVTDSDTTSADTESGRNSKVEKDKSPRALESKTRFKRPMGFRYKNLINMYAISSDHSPR